MTPEQRAILLPVRLVRTVWPPSDLRPGNARFDAILGDIDASGIREPLTISLDWVVLDGHHRLAVARHLGLATVPVRVWTGAELVP